MEQTSIPEDSAHDGGVLRFGALAATAGFVLQLVASAWHPGSAPPNDSELAFHEYAMSSTWEIVHIGQFVGGLLVAIALVAISRAVGRGGMAGGLAMIGGTAAVVWAAILAVQLAVDGVALKATIDSWLAAAPSDRQAAFLVADGVRAIEKGLSSFFLLVNGLSLFALGMAVSIGRRFPRPLGWFGVAAGVGYLAGGVVAAYTGFSPEAEGILGSALLPSIVFLAVLSIAMWRLGGRTPATRWAAVALVPAVRP
jgi:hypothetical protein